VLSHEHGRDRASAERVFHTFDAFLIVGAIAGAIGCAMFAAPVLRLVYGPAFAAAAPALFWISVGLIPLLSNSGRKVYLYASGGEDAVVGWSAVALVIQAIAGVVMIPVLGGAGAAIAIAIGEAVIWWPLRKSARTAPRSSPRRAPAPTLAPLLQSVPVALDPQAER
jgi:O-antigen/teichoic acid export membrane protein